MKHTFLLFLLLLFACSSNKKVYVCGDHVCIDKKEFKEYFAENLIMEIQTQSLNEKNSTVDLVKLNTTPSNFNKKDEIFLQKEDKVRLKEEKIRLKEERVRLKKERKIKEIEKKNRIKEEKKLAKLSKSNENDDGVAINKTIDNNSSKINIAKNEVYLKDEIKENKVPKEEVVFNSLKTENTTSLCNEIKDCDIDKIAELLIKKGRKKDFPDITSN